MSTKTREALRTAVYAFAAALVVVAAAFHLVDAEQAKALTDMADKAAALGVLLAALHNPVRQRRRADRRAPLTDGPEL